LPAATQACQAAHAAFEFGLSYPRLTADWHASSGVLVLLAAPSELELSRIHVDVAAAGLRAVPFHEPDLDGALTAIAVEPAGWRFLARLPAMLARFTSSSGEEVKDDYDYRFQA
jgi:hypothetical protein